MISIFKSSVSAHLTTPSIITPIQRHTGLSVHSCVCDQRTLVGPLGHLGRVDAGQADGQSLAAVIDPQGVAIPDGEHGGRLGGEGEQQGEGELISLRLPGHLDRPIAEAHIVTATGLARRCWARA